MTKFMVLPAIAVFLKLCFSAFRQKTVLLIKSPSSIFDIKANYSNEKKNA